MEKEDGSLLRRQRPRLVRRRPLAADEKMALLAVESTCTIANVSYVPVHSVGARHARVSAGPPYF